MRKKFSSRRPLLGVGAALVLSGMVFCGSPSQAAHYFNSGKDFAGRFFAGKIGPGANIAAYWNAPSAPSRVTERKTGSGAGPAQTRKAGPRQLLHTGPVAPARLVDTLGAPPTDIEISNTSFDEGQDTTTALLTFSSVDADAGDTFTYTLVDGEGADDNSAFTIAEDALYAASVLDFETKSTFTILVRTTDQTGNFYEKAFTLEAVDVPEAPVLEPDTLSVAEDSFHYNLPEVLLANDEDSDGDELSIVEVGNATHGRVGWDGPYISFVPDADFFGQASFQYKVSDGVHEVWGNATVEVTSLNDAPRFLPGRDQIHLVDAGAITRAGWATEISPGAANETTQAFNFEVTHDNPGLFAVEPALSSDGTLTYTLAPGATGEAAVSVVLKDDGGVVDGGEDTSFEEFFSIIVYTSNAPPVIESINFLSSSPPYDTIGPAAPRTNDVLMVEVDISDDNDAYTDATITWFKNGVEIPGETQPLLLLALPGYGDKNDVITCTITASEYGDGGLSSAPQSESVTIVNSVPQVKPVELPARIGSKVLVWLSAFDEDDDTLTYNATGAEGTVAFEGDSLMLYTAPATGAALTDEFDIEVQDGEDTTSVTGTMLVQTLAAGSPLYTAVGGGDVQGIGATDYDDDSFDPYSGYTRIHYSAAKAYAPLLTHTDRLGDTLGTPASPLTLSRRALEGITLSEALNMGVGGNTTASLAAEDAASLYTVWYGPNDLVWEMVPLLTEDLSNLDDPAALNAIAETYMTGWESNYTTLKSMLLAGNPNAKFAAIGTPDLGPDLAYELGYYYDLTWDQESNLADAITNACTRMNAHIQATIPQVVDLQNNTDLGIGEEDLDLCGCDDYFLDGLHPSDSGYQKLATRLFNLVDPLFPHAPKSLSVNPEPATSIAGVAQSLSAVYSDKEGAADIRFAYVLVNSHLTSDNALLAFLNVQQNRLWVWNGTAFVGGHAPGSAHTITVPQGKLNCLQTSVVPDGNELTVEWNFTPNPTNTFLGNKKVFLTCYDAANTSRGWQYKSNWNITDGPVAPYNLSLNPSSVSSAAGTGQNLTAVYRDGNGVGDIRYAYIQVSSTLGGSGLQGFYSVLSNRLWLWNGSDYIGGFAPESSNTISVLQGTLNCAQTTVAKTGTDLTVNWNFTPRGDNTFLGAKNVYLRVWDEAGLGANWEDMGNWTIGARPGAPTNISVTPASATSVVELAQNISALYRDGDGAGDIKLAYVLVNTTNSIIGGFHAYYNPVSTKLWVWDGTTYVGGYPAGSGHTITVPQGTLNCADTTVSGSGNDLTVHWNITPSATFTGTKNVYLMSFDQAGNKDGFDALATWNITSSPTLVAPRPSGKAVTDLPPSVPLPAPVKEEGELGLPSESSSEKAPQAPSGVHF